MRVWSYMRGIGTQPGIRKRLSRANLATAAYVKDAPVHVTSAHLRKDHSVEESSPKRRPATQLSTCAANRLGDIVLRPQRPFDAMISQFRRTQAFSYM